MMKTMHKLEGSSFRIEMLELPAMQRFISSHASALDTSFKHVPMSDAMRRRLERSNYIFSGLKTFHELHETFPSLIDENGNRKPFERFLNDVRKVDETYNSNYLRAEYNFVANSATMASKWEQFAKDGDRYYLQYRTAGDKRVRPEHAELNGITLPITDSFWESYYPPNGWNCRCNVVQVRKNKYPATNHDEAMARGEAALQHDKKGIFRFNPGIQQKAIPDYNPYTIRRCNTCPLAKGDKTQLAVFIPDNELCAACSIVHQCYGDRTKSARAIERMHYLHEMEPLIHKKVKVNGNGHPMSVGFRKKANQHLFSDTFGRTKVITKDDLAKLDTILEMATFVKKSGLSKKRIDDIKRFYYYKAKVNGQTVYLNVAEEDYKRNDGKYNHKRYLYSITDKIK